MSPISACHQDPSTCQFSGLPELENKEQTTKTSHEEMMESQR